MLWIPTQGKPTKKHATRQEAQEEAIRLVKKHGMEVMLMECIGCYRLKNEPVEYVDVLL